MAVHAEMQRVMEDHFGPAGGNWSNGTPNATASSVSLSAKRLREVIDQANLCGYETKLSSGALVCYPKGT